MEEDYDESDEQKADINEVMDYTNQVCRQISGRMGVRFFFLGFGKGVFTQNLSV